MTSFLSAFTDGSEPCYPLNKNTMDELLHIIEQGRNDLKRKAIVIQAYPLGPGIT